MRNGFSFETAYWFSKAIDLGANYTSTASGIDAREGRGQSEFDVHGDMKAVSDFDQPHAWMTRITWRSPGLRHQPGWMRAAFGRWEAFAVALVTRTGNAATPHPERAVATPMSIAAATRRLRIGGLRQRQYQ